MFEYVHYFDVRRVEVSECITINTMKELKTLPLLTSCLHYSVNTGPRHRIWSCLYDSITPSSSSKINGLRCVFLCCCWPCPFVSRPLRLLCDDSCLTHTQKAFHSLFDQKPTFVVLQPFIENMFLLKKVECDDGLGCSRAIILHWVFCFDRQVGSQISTNDTWRGFFFP